MRISDWISDVCSSDLVAAALTVARAYMAAGCPNELAPLASVECWSRVVRSALVWLGKADPCETMKAARDNDPIVSALGALLHAWHDAIGQAWNSTSKVKREEERRVGKGGGSQY